MCATFADPINIRNSLVELFNDWGEDTFTFVRKDLPHIVAILLVAFILLQLLKVVTHHLSKLGTRQEFLPTAVRAQQLRTVASVTYSIGLFVILFWAAMAILTRMGINVGPLLASAGIAGVAIGFGAQSLVKDFINGFYILVENQFDLGDTVRIAGVQGVVEGMTLRRTTLRDGDGTVHVVSNSQITIVSNLTRDWTQLALHVSVAYGADSDKVVQLLKEVALEVANDPQFKDLIVGVPEVPGIERVSGGEVDYLLLVKTKPNMQFAVSRELRRRIKACFEKYGIEPGNPNRLYVVDAPKPV